MTSMVALMLIIIDHHEVDDDHHEVDDDHHEVDDNLGKL